MIPVGKPDKKLSALDRATQQALGEGKTFGSEDDPARERFPELWRWLSTCYLGRDHIKTPATITIRLGPAGVIATLMDRDLCVSLDITCLHLALVFEHLEVALTADNVPLKNWGKREPHLRKRRSS